MVITYIKIKLALHPADESQITLGDTSLTQMAKTKEDEYFGTIVSHRA